MGFTCTPSEGPGPAAAGPPQFPAGLSPARAHGMPGGGGGVGDRVFPTYLGGWRDPTGAGSSRLPGQLRSLHPKKPSEAGDEGTRCKAAAAGTGGGYAGSSGKSKDGAGSDRGVLRAGATALLEPVPAPAIEGRS